MDFGTRLKKERENKDISQEDFSKRLGVSRSSVGNYETNRNMPTVEILTKMADILDCSIDYLLCRSNIRNFDKLNPDFWTEQYPYITDEQIKQIDDFIRFVLQNNKHIQN